MFSVPVVFRLDYDCGTQPSAPEEVAARGVFDACRKTG
jgi:hypothetical protein